LIHTAGHPSLAVVRIVVVLLTLGARPIRANVELPIAPVQQATPVWCWLAVGEMIFRAFEVPALNDHFQCGIVGTVAIGTARDVCARDCRRCTVPGGDAATVMNMLVEYPRRVALLSGQSVPRLFVSHTGVLRPDELRGELDAGRPIVVGVNPGGRPAAFSAAAHVALVVGYRMIDEQLWLLVNDPYPFSPKTWPDPYLAVDATALAPGRYLLPYRRAVEGLAWTESFLIRRDGDHVAIATRCLASTPLAQTACPAGPTQAPGEPCTCGLARGVVVDQGRP
jgi:hypothetical protein